MKGVLLMQDAHLPVLPPGLLLDERAVGAAQGKDQWQAAPSDHWHAGASGNICAIGVSSQSAPVQYKVQFNASPVHSFLSPCAHVCFI